MAGNGSMYSRMVARATALVSPAPSGPAPRTRRQQAGTEPSGEEMVRLEIVQPNAQRQTAIDIPHSPREWESKRIYSFVGHTRTDTLDAEAESLLRSGAALSLSGEHALVSVTTSGRLPADALETLERTAATVVQYLGLTTTDNPVHVHYHMDSRGAPIIGADMELRTWGLNLHEPLFLSGVEVAPLPTGLASLRLPSVLAVTQRAAEAGLTAVLVSNGQMHSLVLMFPMFAFAVAHHAHAAAVWKNGTSPYTASMAPVSDAALQLVKNAPLGDLLHLLLMDDPDLNVDVLVDIGVSLVGYLIDFMGGVQKTKMLLMWNTRSSDTLGGDTPVFVYSELSDACKIVFGVTFEDLWASWREYLVVANKHRTDKEQTKRELEMKSTMDLIKMTPQLAWTKVLNQELSKTHEEADEEAAAARERERRLEEEMRVTPFKAYMWTLQWWLYEEWYTAARCLIMIIYLGTWQVLETFIMDYIFAESIKVEADGANGFSENQTTVVCVLFGMLVAGNVLAMHAQAQAIFDCPSGGGFIPWIKIEMAKHLSKVSQQHLDNLNVQAVLTVIETDLKVINSNLDMIVTSVSTLGMALGVIMSLFLVATWHITLIVLLTIPVVLMYDYYKSPHLIAASDQLLVFNQKIMTQIEEVLNMVNARRVLGLHSVLDKAMDEQALDYQSGFLTLDKVTVSHMVQMQMFKLFIKVTVKAYGAFMVASGNLDVSAFIAFSAKADDLMELLVGDSGLAGVKRQFDLSCAPLTNLLKLQMLPQDPLQQHPEDVKALNLDLFSRAEPDDSTDEEEDEEAELVRELLESVKDATQFHEEKEKQMGKEQMGKGMRQSKLMLALGKGAPKEPKRGFKRSVDDVRKTVRASNMLYRANDMGKFKSHAPMLGLLSVSKSLKLKGEAQRGDKPKAPKPKSFQDVAKYVRMSQVRGKRFTDTVFSAKSQASPAELLPSGGLSEQSDLGSTTDGGTTSGGDTDSEPNSSPGRPRSSARPRSGEPSHIKKNSEVDLNHLTEEKVLFLNRVSKDWYTKSHQTVTGHTDPMSLVAKKKSVLERFSKVDKAALPKRSAIKKQESQIVLSTLLSFKAKKQKDPETSMSDTDEDTTVTENSEKSRWRSLTGKPGMNKVMALKTKHSFVRRATKGSLQPEYDLKIRDLYFTYPDQELEVLKGVKLTVRSGKKVACLGRSGTGKTTLVNLLCRLYGADSGRLNIGGKSVNTVNLHETVTVMQQESLLFDMSVRENILIGIDPTEEQFHDACNKAALMDDPAIIKNGIDLMVGQKGMKVSLTLRQRVCLARTLVRNTPIVVLDDCTSAQDGFMIDQISSNLRSHTRHKRGLQRNPDSTSGPPKAEDLVPVSVIAFTQSMAFTDGWDIIAMMADGKIVETGSKTELMARKGQYWLMAANQEGLQILGGQPSITAKRLHLMWPFFPSPSVYDLQQFQSCFTATKLNEGEVLYKAGSQMQGMYVLFEGSIEETGIDRNSGRMKVVRNWSIGDSAGEEALFSEDLTWRNTTIAKARTMVLCLTQGVFKKTLDTVPATKKAVLEGHETIQSTLGIKKLAMVWPFVGLHMQTLNLIRKNLTMEVVEYDRDLFKQPEDRCSAMYILIKGKLHLINKKVLNNGSLKAAYHTVQEGEVLGEVVPCCDTDMAYFASSWMLQARTTERTLLAKLTANQLQQVYDIDSSAKKVVQTNIAQYKELMHGRALLNHWVFAGVPEDVAVHLATTFKITAEPQGRILFQRETSLNLKRMMFIIRGKLALNFVNRETGTEFNAYAGPGTLLNAVSLHEMVQQAGDEDQEMRMSDVLATAETAELCVIATTNSSDIAAILAQHACAKHVHRVVKDLGHGLSKLTTLAGIKEIGLGHVQGPQLQFIRLFHSMQIVDVGVNILEHNVPSTYTMMQDEVLPEDPPGYIWQQLCVVLQGEVVVTTTTGETLNVATGFAFTTPGVQLRDSRLSVVANVVEAEASEDVDDVTVYASFNLECLRPERSEMWKELMAATMEEQTKRAELKEEIRILQRESQALKRELGLLPPFAPRSMWRRGFDLMKTSSSHDSRTDDDPKRQATGRVEDLLLEAKEELLKMRDLHKQRVKDMKDLYKQWESILPTMPQDPHLLSKLKATMKNLTYQHYQTAKGWYEAVVATRLKHVQLNLVTLEKLWVEFPAAEDDFETIAARQKLRNFALQGLDQPVGHNEFRLMEEELHDMRECLRPAIVDMVARAKELCTELMYTELNDGLADALRRAETDIHEDTRDVLQQEMRKLEIAADIVRPLLKLANEERTQSLADKERMAEQREMAAFNAGVQETLFRRQKQVGLLLGRNVADPTQPLLLPGEEDESGATSPTTAPGTRRPSLLGSYVRPSTGGATASLLAEQRLYAERIQRQEGAREGWVQLSKKDKEEIEQEKFVRRIRNKSLLWGVVHSTERMQASMAELEGEVMEAATMRGELLTQAKLLLDGIGSGERGLAQFPEGIEAATRFQFQRGLLELRTQWDQMQTRRDQLLYQCQRIMLDLDDFNPVEANRRLKEIYLKELWLQEVSLENMKDDLVAKKQAQDDEKARLAEEARLEAERRRAEEEEAALLLQRMFRGFLLRRNLRQCKNLMGMCTSIYKASGKKVGDRNRFFKTLSPDVTTMRKQLLTQEVRIRPLKLQVHDRRLMGGVRDGRQIRVMRGFHLLKMQQRVTELWVKMRVLSIDRDATLDDVCETFASLSEDVLPVVNSLIEEEEKLKTLAAKKGQQSGKKKSGAKKKPAAEKPPQPKKGGGAKSKKKGSTNEGSADQVDGGVRESEMMESTGNLSETDFSMSETDTDMEGGYTESESESETGTRAGHWAPTRSKSRGPNGPGAGTAENLEALVEADDEGPTPQKYSGRRAGRPPSGPGSRAAVAARDQVVDNPLGLGSAGRLPTPGSGGSSTFVSPRDKRSNMLIQAGLGAAVGKAVERDASRLIAESSLDDDF